MLTLICAACYLQWRIQDFPDVGAPTYYLAKNFPKIAWIRKKLDPEGARVPGAPLDPPMTCVERYLIVWRWYSPPIMYWIAPKIVLLSRLEFPTVLVPRANMSTSKPSTITGEDLLIEPVTTENVSSLPHFSHFGCRLGSNDFWGYPSGDFSFWSCVIDKS